LLALIPRDAGSQNDGEWGDDDVTEAQIKGRALSLAVPKGSITAIQREAIEAARIRAKMSNMNLPVDIIITEF
jgi:hypothetical protein